MKRDMDLCRKILFKIEELYDSTAIYNLEIEGYTRNQVAYHSNLLYEAGLISDYKAQYADNEIYSFGVSSLTWDGHDFLDKIREDTTWNKVKDIIKNKALPMTLDVIKTVATGVITATLQSMI
ncbi:DUF2513 domain-containing protein [Lacrimispora amygdalina]|uniref:DUF2513 domain-containing protein n=1 Tax=Lacrimispora amygdalina TaxID=253257 RepID=A0A3E2N689_9FIRM|nr:DUF2513 domain-containing protein [Clostridium indicum]RFZ76464.1 DUF2513 domain-containing protein [Clostridium indicum]